MDADADGRGWGRRYPREVPDVALCLDVGSTYTKGAAVELGTGHLLGTAEHRTTLDGDVLDGVAAVRAELNVAVDAPTYACSSAGGGLRLAVVGYEREISAEAGRRVALSAGARVVYVGAGRLDRAARVALAAARPDVILLTGGTDGGEESVLLHNAAALAAAHPRVPVVVAGNGAVREEAAGMLAVRRRLVFPTTNVLPDIGVIEPGPAREAIRAVFLRHVIGGKGLSRGPRFARLVSAVTPDAVLEGVALLGGLVRAADAGARGVVVVDVGGATTDVYSALAPEDSRSAVAPLWDRRTVEGDLGMRWSAESLLAAADAERLDVRGLAQPAARRTAAVDLLPTTAAERAVDARLGALAVIVALRRHVREEGVYDEGSVSASGASLVVLSGGVFRHLDAAARGSLIDALRADRGGARAVLDRARVVVDDSYLLAPAGLLRTAHPVTARRLVTTLLSRDP
ncbi:MAG: glutamate mutase L [Geodermatophilaceae bacterium]|nr:glutamate mutase L [Geodermatophilaceae bacterium]